MAGYRRRIGKSEKYAVHFQKLTHPQRIALVNHVKDLHIRTISILCCKTEMKSPEFLADGFNLYFYLTRYLLERVSWICRDHARDDDGGDGTVKITFSNRSSMKYDNLIAYMQKLRRRNDVQISWPHVVPDKKHLCTLPHHQRAGLQVVDAVASSYGQAVEALKYDCCDPGFVRVIDPVAYRYKLKTLIGYGVKIFPAEAVWALEGRGDLPWFQ